MEIDASTSLHYCGVCALALATACQHDAHCAGRKHQRRLRYHDSGLVDPAFDAALVKYGVERILVLGDCHGGRVLCLYSSLVRSSAYGGSIFSWCVRPSRVVPPLREVLGRDHRALVTAMSPPRGDEITGRDKTLVLVMSYGEIDVRCHSLKWSNDVDAGSSKLANAYIAKTRDYVREYLDELSVTSADGVDSGTMPRVAVCVIILAVPPPSDQGHNPKAPFVGNLSDRIQATKALNRALGQAVSDCGARDGDSVGAISLYFTGVDTWDFATNGDGSGGGAAPESGLAGSLRADMSDGHVHVQPSSSAPLHRIITAILAGAFKIKTDDRSMAADESGVNLRVHHPAPPLIGHFSKSMLGHTVE